MRRIFVLVFCSVLLAGILQAQNAAPAASAPATPAPVTPAATLLKH